MFLIRWALQNSFVVLAITLGLVFLGAAVVPGIPTDVLPDFKTPVVVSFFSLPGPPDARYGKKRDLSCGACTHTSWEAR